MILSLWVLASAWSAEAPPADTTATPTSEKSSQENPAPENPAPENPATEKPATEKPATKQPTAEEKAAQDEPAVPGATPAAAAPEPEKLPEDPALLYQMAKEAYKAKKFLRASMLFERAYAKDKNPTLLLNSAHMRVKAGDYLGAAEIYRQVFSNAEISEAVRDSAQKKLSEIIPYLSHAWIRFTPELAQATCVVDEGVVDTSTDATQKLNPGTHLVGWSNTRGEFAFVIKRLIAGTTTTFDGKLDPSKVCVIDLKPSLPGTRVMRLGTLSIALPKGTARIQTPMRYSGEIVLLGPDGSPLARRISDLAPGEKMPWAWSVPAKPMSPTTAQTEAESGFPWKWVIIGGVTVAVAAGATAYFMMQGDEGPPIDAEHLVDDLGD